MFADLVRRVLLFAGYRVTWVMNITDVDDKIIRDAAAAGISIEELTEGHTRTFLEDLAALGIPEPDVMPRATAHIGDMVRLTETLIERGNAYRTDDGSVFFKIGVVAVVRPTRAHRPRSTAARRARRRRRVRQGRHPRFRALEGRQARRTQLVDARRRGTAGLAHRVLGDEHALSGGVVRHPYRRRRPRLPPPRGRDRPVRGGDRRDVRADVAPLRPPPDGRPEDGQARGQPGSAGRALRARCLSPGAALRAHGHALPLAARVHRREPRRGDRRGRAASDGAARAPGLSGGRQ